MPIVQTRNYSASSSSTSHTISFSSVAAGNKIIVLVATYYSISAYTGDYTRDAYLGGNQQSNVYLAAFSKTAVGGETSFNVQISQSGLSLHMQMMEVSGLGAFAGSVSGRLSGSGSSVTSSGSLTVPPGGAVFGALDLHVPSNSNAGTWSGGLTASSVYVSSANNLGQFGSAVELAGGTSTYSVSGFSAGSNGADALWVTYASSVKTVSPTSIGSTETFGTARLNQQFYPSSISSGETFGTAAIQYSQEVNSQHIPSQEAFGSAQLNLKVTPSAITSQESWGTLFVGGALVPEGISSEESWGVPSVIRQVLLSPSGISSAEAWGNGSLSIGSPQTVSLNSIPSGEYWWAPELKERHRFVLRPRTIQETPMARNILHIRYGIHRGISILKRHDGTYYQTRFPAQTEIEECEAYYLGGHEYTVSQEVAQELINAGFNDCLTLELAE